MGDHVTPAWYQRGRRWLMKQDPRLAAIIKL